MFKLVCDSRKEGSYQESALNELSQSQLLLLAHLTLNEQKEWENLKQLMAIPFQKMNEDKKSEAKAELEKLDQEILKLLGGNRESILN